jgi:hypothetical protein
MIGLIETPFVQDARKVLDWAKGFREDQFEEALLTGMAAWLRDRHGKIKSARETIGALAILSGTFGVIVRN